MHVEMINFGTLAYGMGHLVVKQQSRYRPGEAQRVPGS